MHDGLGPGALREDCAETVALIAPLCALALEHELSVAVAPPGFPWPLPRRPPCPASRSTAEHAMSTVPDAVRRVRDPMTLETALEQIAACAGDLDAHPRFPAETSKA